jgi:hypothetical protein
VAKSAIERLGMLLGIEPLTYKVAGKVSYADPQLTLEISCGDTVVGSLAVIKPVLVNCL